MVSVSDIPWCIKLQYTQVGAVLSANELQSAELAFDVTVKYLVHIFIIHSQNMIFVTHNAYTGYEDGISIVLR